MVFLKTDLDTETGLYKLYYCSSCLASSTLESLDNDTSSNWVNKCQWSSIEHAVMSSNNWTLTDLVSLSMYNLWDWSSMNMSTVQ